MLRETGQTVLRYLLESVPMLIFYSHSLPSNHLNLLFWEANAPVTDKAWTIALFTVLGLSVFALFVTWINYRDPIFPSRSIFKLPQYHQVGESNDVNGTHEIPELSKPEPLEGWRLRFGVLHAAVLIALLATHIAILLINGRSPFGFVFIAYWVVDSKF